MIKNVDKSIDEFFEKIASGDTNKSQAKSTSGATKVEKKAPVVVPKQSDESKALEETPKSVQSKTAAVVVPKVESKAAMAASSKTDTNKDNSNKKRTKSFWITAVPVTAIFLAWIALISQIGKRNKKDLQPAIPQTPEKTITSISNTNLSELGEDLPYEEIKEGQKYGETLLGVADSTQVVADENGKIWVNQEAKDNSSKVGTVIVDTKNGTLTVESDGTVVESTGGYEIKDQNGTTISSGNGSTPAGTVYDNNQNAYVAPSDAGKYVQIDANYYDKVTGELRLPKGDLIEKEKLEEAKKIYTTVPPVNETKKEEVIQEPEVVADAGKYNSDGTYSNYGLTFESKADCDQWILQSGEGYVLGSDGIMRSIEAQNSNQKTK